ncbi:hypothetical protein Trydic_g13585 [Trypoxylus dichotomus]
MIPILSHLYLLFYMTITSLIPESTTQECGNPPIFFSEYPAYAVCKVITKSKSYTGTLISSIEVIVLTSTTIEKIDNVCCKGPTRQPPKCRKPSSRDEGEGVCLVTLSKKIRSYRPILNRTGTNLESCKVIGLYHDDYSATITIVDSMLDVTCRCLSVPKLCEEGDAVICNNRLLGIILNFEGTKVLEVNFMEEIFGEVSAIDTPHHSFNMDNWTNSYWAILRGAARQTVDLWQIIVSMSLTLFAYSNIISK